MFSKSPFKNVILKSIWNTSKSHTITLAINTLIEVSLTTTAKILLKSRPCFYDNIWPLVVLCDVQLPFEHFFGFEKHNPIALRYSFDNLDNIYILFLFRDSIFFSTITFHWFVASISKASAKDVNPEKYLPCLHNLQQLQNLLTVSRIVFPY